MKKSVLPVWLSVGVSIAPVLPVCWLILAAMMNALGADPGKAMVHELGIWALHLLLFTLCITPLQRFTRWQWLPLRRRLGLWALAYALLHVLAYEWFYVGPDITRFLQELTKRPYIWVGAVALGLLMALGITSTRGWQRRLGRRWKLLHRSVYLIVALVLVHFGWQVKSGLGAMPWYALVFVVLLFTRLPAKASH